jgi:hypothetical protein
VNSYEETNMKLIIPTAIAALISTAAVADVSTKVQDQRLDTSVSGSVATSGNREANVAEDRSTKAQDLRLQTQADGQADVTYSSRNNDARSPGQGYIYGGYGPGNDSR